jgi:hypothetical protein
LADKVEIAEGFRRLIQRVICESDGVAGNFGGVAGELGAQRTAGVDSPDHDLYGPQQTAEDNFVGILNDIGHMLDVWEQKNYMSDEARYQSYFEDLQNLLEEYDPCAHRGEKCEDSHPGQSHEECVEVTINNALYEKKKYVSSFYKNKEKRAEKLIDKGVPEDVAYGVADTQMSKAGKKKKKRGKK